MTVTPFPVTADEAEALRALQVVVWWCRLVIAQGRGGIYPLGNDPDLTDAEQTYVDAHVNAVGGGHVELWQWWQQAGLPPLDPSLKFRA